MFKRRTVSKCALINVDLCDKEKLRADMQQLCEDGCFVMENQKKLVHSYLRVHLMCIFDVIILITLFMLIMTDCLVLRLNCKLSKKRHRTTVLCCM